MPGLKPERHIFSVTTTAKRVLEAVKMRGTKILVLQADPDNTDDILFDVAEAKTLEKPLQLTPGASHVLDAPPSRGGSPPFGVGKPSDDEYWFEFDVVLQSVAGTQAATLWLYKPLPTAGKGK